jgi:hypothetical protein
VNWFLQFSYIGRNFFLVNINIIQMNQKTLLSAFIAALSAAAIVSALLYVVPLIDGQGGQQTASTSKIVASFFFIMVVEALRAIFVISNTYIRRISKTWGIAMIFMSLLVTAGFAVAIWHAYGKNPQNEFFFWIGQIYNVLILASEWSVGTVVTGLAIKWKDLEEDFKNVDSLKYDIYAETGGTAGLIDWQKMPEILWPLQDVMKGVHSFIDVLQKGSQGHSEQAASWQKKFENLQVSTSGKVKIFEFAANMWALSGNSRRDYVVFCGGIDNSGDCKPFETSRNNKQATCPGCGKHHDRERAQEAFQQITGAMYSDGGASVSK